MLTQERLAELKKYAQGGDDVTFSGLARALMEVLGHAESLQSRADGLEEKVDALNVQAAKDRDRAEAAERRAVEMEGMLEMESAERVRCRDGWAEAVRINEGAISSLDAAERRVVEVEASLKEKHAAVLGVADGGRYRNDWDGAVDGLKRHAQLWRKAVERAVDAETLRRKAWAAFIGVSEWDEAVEADVRERGDAYALSGVPQAIARWVLYGQGGKT